MSHKETSPLSPLSSPSLSINSQTKNTPTPTPSHTITPILPQTPFTPATRIRTPTSTPTTKNASQTMEHLAKRVEKKIKKFEQKGRKHGAVTYRAYSFIQVVTYIALLMKYQAKCAIIDKDLNNLRVFCEDTYCHKNQTLFSHAEKLAKDILDCIHRGEKLICIPIGIAFLNNNIGHANMLFYRPHQRTIERFEPHGPTFFNNWMNYDSNVNHILKELFEVHMKPFLKEYTPTYSTPAQVCPTIPAGFQILEEQITQLEEEGGGFCGMWSLFTMELMFLNPNMNTQEILELAYKTTQSDPQYLRNLIRGYVIQTEKLLDTYMKKIDQSASFQFSTDFSTFYSHKDKIQAQLLTLLLSHGSQSTLVDDLRGKQFSPKTKSELRQAIEIHMQEKRNGIPHTKGSINSWNVSHIQDMAALFHGIPDFNENIQDWNVSNVQDMTAMFYGCTEFNQPIHSWNTSNVTNTSYMFYGCTKFNQPINSSIHSWNISNVTNTSHMFHMCDAFNQPLYNWNTSRVTNMSFMFAGCTYFNQLLHTWDTSEVTNMELMFAQCMHFNQPLYSWNTSKVTNMKAMFFKCIYFNQSLTNWNISNVTNMDYMFVGCVSFNQLLRWKKYTDKISHVEMFHMSNNSSYENNIIDVYTPKTKEELSKAIKEYLLENMTGVTEHVNGYMNTWDVSKITDMSKLFQNMQDFNEDIQNWETSQVINMHAMFSGCTHFNQPLHMWNTSNVKYMHHMFRTCIWFNQSLHTWDTSKVTNMSYMFEKCMQLKDVFIEKWNTSNVTNMENMFAYCDHFNTPLSKWNVSKVTNMNGMFMYCKSFHQELHWKQYHMEKKQHQNMFLHTKTTFQDAIIDIFRPKSKEELRTAVVEYMEELISQIHTARATSHSHSTPHPHTTPQHKHKHKNGNINNWDVTQITDMSSLLYCEDDYIYAQQDQITQEEYNTMNTHEKQELSKKNNKRIQKIKREIQILKHFNQPIHGWDTSKVTNMEGMFQGCAHFNQPLNEWDTSNVTNMTCMFQGCAKFNQPLFSNVDSVEEMIMMFSGCNRFNQPLDHWNPQNVNSMDNMFEECHEFNQPLNSWNVSNVTSMSDMFMDCFQFNQPLYKWDISNVTNMNSMFSECKKFSQKLGWKKHVDKIMHHDMFDGAGISYEEAMKEPTAAATNSATAAAATAITAPNINSAIQNAIGYNSHMMPHFKKTRKINPSIMNKKNTITQRKTKGGKTKKINKQK